MKLWWKVFLLSSVTSLAAILGMGILNFKAGYTALFQGIVQGLRRDIENASRAVQRQWETARALSLAFPGNELVSPENVSSLTAYFRSSIPSFVDPQISIEMRSPDGTVLLSGGPLKQGFAAENREELTAAYNGKTAYVPRRVVLEGKEEPALFLSSPARIGNTDLLMSAAAPMSDLDTYWRRQVLLIAAGCAAAAVLLLGSSFIGSRAIARRFELLARRTEAVAAGDYSGRIPETGGDEVASLARELNVMAAKIEETVERLRAEKEDRQRFIDSLTHEMRTPVTSIIGLAEVLALRTPDEEVRARCLKNIQGEGARLLSLMESLKRLLIARETGRERAPLDVGPFLKAITERMAGRCAEGGVSLRMEADPGIIHADGELLAAAVENLLDNALRASPAGNEVVAGFRACDRPVIYVRDHGRGMTDDELTHAGHPFFRGAGRDGRTGFGLGLAICREIASRHGAVLSLERAEGCGIIARIVFPNLRGIYTADRKS